MAKRTCRKSWDDEVFGQSARLAFYFFFALSPLLLALLILLDSTTAFGSEWRATLTDALTQVLPPDASALVVHTVEELSARAIMGAGAILAGIGAAWGTLNGTWSIMTGLNKAYEVEENRPWWRVLAITLGLTVCLSFLGLLALAAIRSCANLLDQHLHDPTRVSLMRHIADWALILPLLLLGFATLYRFGPNLRDRRWQWSNHHNRPLTAFASLLRVYQQHASSSQ